LQGKFAIFFGKEEGIVDLFALRGYNEDEKK
jgi:hypothetical protein